VIPEAAVEAAAKAMAFSDHNDTEAWTAYKNDARAALEAAAPHLIQAAKAEAWDEGYRGCYERYMYEPVPDNPYR
jgi:hypothetical protein